MAFEHLIEQPMPEEKIVEQVTLELRRRFEAYQDSHFFIRLTRCEGKTSKVAWIKVFPDAQSLWEFIWDTTHDRACVLIKFDGEFGNYHVHLRGHFVSNLYDIWEHRERSHKSIKIAHDRESRAMIPRELIEGFSEIAGELESTKRNISKKAI